MNRTLWLITEHPNDAKIVVEILRLRGMQINIEAVALPDNKRGLNHMPQELPKLIETTKAAKRPNDVIAVLIDAERYKPRHERHNHKQVAAICRRHRPDVKLLWSVQEIEAWILADSGVCSWLGIEAQPTNNLREVKEKLQSLLHNRGLSWRSRDRGRVFQQMRGDGEQRNKSLSHLLRYINTLR